MSKTLSSQPRTKLPTILTIGLFVLLAVVGGVIVFSLSRGGFDIRSKAADYQDILKKEWNFDTDSDPQGWYGQVLSTFSVAGGKLQTAFNPGRKNIQGGIRVDGITDLILEKGVKQVKINLAVIFPSSVASKSYTFTLKYRSGQSWKTKKFSGTADGVMREVSFALPDTNNRLAVTNLSIEYTNAPWTASESTKVDIDSIKLYSKKKIGNITKVGTLESQAILRVSKTKYNLAGSVPLDYVGKKVRVSGALSYSSNGITPIITITSIERIDQDVEVASWQFDTEGNPEGWNQVSLASFQVTGGALKAQTSGSTNDAIINYSVGKTLGKGAKKVVVDLKSTNDFTLTGSYRVGGNWKNLSPVSVEANTDNSYEMTIPGSKSRGIQQFRFNFSKAPAGTVVLVDAISLYVAKPVGTLTDVVGKLTDANQFTSKGVTYALEFDESVSQLAGPYPKTVRLTGDIKYVGTVKTIDVESMKETTAEVVVRTYTASAGWNQTNVLSLADSGIFHAKVTRKPGKVSNYQLTMSDGANGISLPKGNKYIRFTVGSTGNLGNVILRNKNRGSNLAAHTVRVGGAGTYTVELTNNAIVVDQLTFEFSQASVGTEIQITSVEFVSIQAQ